MAKQKHKAEIETGAKAPDLVKMARPEPAHPQGPTTADVHPDEIADWLAHGWQIVTKE